MKKLAFSLLMFFVASGIIIADEFTDDFNKENRNIYLLAPALSVSLLTSKTDLDPNNYKSKRAIQTARWVGAISGAGISALHLYWMTQDRGMGWRVWATGVPPIIISSYVGMQTTGWATK